MSSVRTKIILAIIALVLLQACCLGQSTDLIKDEWMGIYVHDTKIGYEHTTVKKALVSGKPGYHYIFEGVIQLRDVDFTRKTVISNDVYLNEQCVPVNETYKMVTYYGEDPSELKALSTRTISVEYGAKEVRWQESNDGKKSRKKIAIPEQANLSLLCQYDLGIKKWAIGDIVQGYELDLPECRFDKVEHRADRRAKVDIGDSKYELLEVVSKQPSDKPGTDVISRSYLLDNGTVIKDETHFDCFDVYTLWQSRYTAEKLSACYISDIKSYPTIPEYLKVMELDALLVGVPFDNKYISSDSRQKAEYVPEKSTIRYRISAQAFDSTKSVKLPIKDDQYSDYLKESTGIESNDKKIRKLARKIVGKEDNAYLAALKLRDWVYENIVGCDYLEDAPLSAKMVLELKAGVCRHMAVLHAALARSVGIPTRVVTGWTYSEGLFVGHAWVVCYVGEWIPLDPTLPDEYVDALHVKLSEWTDVSNITKGGDIIFRLMRMEITSVNGLPVPGPANQTIDIELNDQIEKLKGLYRKLVILELQDKIGDEVELQSRSQAVSP